MVRDSDTPQNESPSPARRKVCIVPPPGLQGLLMSNGLVRLFALDHTVIVATRVQHAKALPRLFHDTRVRFWFDEDPEEKSREHGYEVVRLPSDPVTMYTAFGLRPLDMHALGEVRRDYEKERDVLHGVVNKYGESFVLTWNMHDDTDAPSGALDPVLLPGGISIVDACRVPVDDPFDLCGLMQEALQIHAVDSWFLTLSDMVGGSCQKFCHAYASKCSPRECRRKYRKRILVVSRASECR